MLDRAELERLYRELEQPLYNVALRWTWNAAEAQELVQEAFVRVWAGRRRIRAQSAKAYIYRTVLNLAQKHARRREVWRRVRGWLSVEALPASEPGRGIDRQRVREAIRALPEPQRAVLLLCEFSDLKQREIAAILDIPPGTVASRRDLAVRRLKEVLT